MFPAKVPTLDVRSVGAGGGSIADVSELTGSLRVGPRSAGAQPGPVSYGRGGTEPTVSDANVVLGYLPPLLLGGDMTLDVEAARQARRRHRRADRPVAGECGQGHHRHRQRGDAGGAARHHRAARPRSARFRHRRLRRRRPAACQRAGRAARLLSGAGAAQPGRALSALGFLEADFKNEFVQTFIRSTVGLDPGRGLVALRRARGKGHRPGSTSRTLRPGTPRSATRSTFATNSRASRSQFRSAPMRCTGRARSTQTLDDFHAIHERLYGVRFHVPVELVALRVVARGATPPIDEAAPAGRRAETSQAAIIETQPAYFDGAWHGHAALRPREARRRRAHRWPGHHPPIRHHHRAAARPLRRDRRARQYPDLAGFEEAIERHGAPRSIPSRSTSSRTRSRTRASRWTAWSCASRCRRSSASSTTSSR